MFIYSSLFLWTSNIAAQTITTEGNKIYGSCGDELTLHGVNYAPYNWGYSPNELFIDEIAKSSANCVRLVWYKDTGDPVANSVYQDTSNLADVLQSCIDNKLIPILELHDQTFDNNHTALEELSEWYYSDEIFPIIKRFEHSLILNLFNEALWIDWTGDAESDEEAFVETYSSIIKNIRAEGIKAPLMIDGSECGTNIWSFSRTGPALLEANNLNNIILSTHTYWFYVGQTAEELELLLGGFDSINIPLVIGELANYQDENFACEHDLNYQELARICESKNIGWMVWSWDNDFCDLRQMTSTGYFEDLTTFGEVMVNDEDFGLLTNPPPLSEYLVNDGTCNLSNVDGSVSESSVTIFPNPTSGSLKISGIKGASQIHIFDYQGKLVHSEIVNEEEYSDINTNHLLPGFYSIQIVNEETQEIIVQKLLKI